jgi:hypothetical protein
VTDDYFLSSFLFAQIVEDSDSEAEEDQGPPHAAHGGKRGKNVKKKMGIKLGRYYRMLAFCPRHSNIPASVREAAAPALEPANTCSGVDFEPCGSRAEDGSSRCSPAAGGSQEPPRPAPNLPFVRRREGELSWGCIRAAEIDIAALRCGRGHESAWDKGAYLVATPFIIGGARMESSPHLQAPISRCTAYPKPETAPEQTTEDDEEGGGILRCIAPAPPPRPAPPASVVAHVPLPPPLPPTHWPEAKRMKTKTKTKTMTMTKSSKVASFGLPRMKTPQMAVDRLLAEVLREGVAPELVLRPTAENRPRANSKKTSEWASWQFPLALCFFFSFKCPCRCPSSCE